MSTGNRFQKGLIRRRQVLGDEYVNNAIHREDAFNSPIQKTLTENIWSDIWTRDDITLRERSLITVSFLIALNRPHELRLHLNAARRNGCSLKDLRELVLQASVYCGAPAAVDATKHINEIFADDIAAWSED